jgi:SAM-dependent methyltransferase
MTNIKPLFIRYPIPHSNLTLSEKLISLIGFGLARCNVCGKYTLIKVHGENLRETCTCIWCKSTNRQRQIAYVICSVLSSLRDRSLSSLREIKKVPDLTIYNTEARGALNDQLCQNPGYTCSEYFGNGYASGQLVAGVMHQDLMSLSLNDSSVDLVISSDVFEHIPDPYAAHQEVLRILRPGGRHVFTVPFYQTEWLDEQRTALAPDDTLIFLKPPQYHSDPIRSEGALVYQVFSLEMIVKLAKIGFRVNMYHLHSPMLGIWGPNALVFEAIKPAS